MTPEERDAERQRRLEQTVAWQAACDAERELDWDPCEDCGERWCTCVVREPGGGL